MRKPKRKLQLKRESLRKLDQAELGAVAGAGEVPYTENEMPDMDGAGRNITRCCR
jgi:hypothetical protein